jgi:hypothetical protein
MREPELDGVDAPQKLGAERRIAADDFRELSEIDGFIGDQNQQARRYWRERGNFAQTGQDGGLG